VEASRLKAEEEAEAGGGEDAATAPQSPARSQRGPRPAASEPSAPQGTLASSEELAALRDRLSGQS